MNIRRITHFPPEILFSNDGPCVSIYQPTDRSLSNKKSEQVRFKNLLRDVENSLKENYKDVDVQEYLKPLYTLAEDNIFWNHTLDGLAVLLNGSEVIYYLLNRTVTEFSDVSNQFYVKPLIRNYQSYDKYYALGLSQNTFKLYEGTRYSFSEVEFNDDVITDKEDLLEFIDRRGLTLGSYSGSSGPGFHGYNPKDDVVEEGIHKFFRYVDSFVEENYTSHSHVPLILISLPENQGIFRNVSKNPDLLSNGIRKSSDTINVKDMNEDVWKIIEPIYLDKTTELIDRFKASQTNFRASTDLVDISHAAYEGKIGTLLIEDDRIIAGAFDPETRKVVEGDIKDPHVGDLINQLALKTMENNGEVVVLPKDRMPSETGCAAIYRY